MLFSITFTIFFINPLYSTFTSLIVSEGGVATGQSLSLAHSLVKRVDIPPDQLCDSPAQWVRRECVTGLSDREWQDICLLDDGRTDWWVGECPDDTMCQNTLTQDETDKEPVGTVSCVQRPTTSNQIALDEQCGVYAVSSTSDTNPTLRITSVVVETNLADATVSGMLEGSDANYVIASSMAATLHGTTTKLCNYNGTNLNCVPTGRHTLKAGDTIDFTFVLENMKTALFYYAIIAPTKLAEQMA